MAETVSVELSINGQKVKAEVLPQLSLARFLRQLGHSDVKCGCEAGDCGSCAVFLDGSAVKSCIVLAADCNGKEVWTDQGLTLSDALTKRLQKAFIDYGAIQCGYCTPGMIIAARDYLLKGGTADRRSVREAIAGNLCRCTGYKAIVDAICLVADDLTKNKG